jgi:hypothetical protein
VVHFVGALKSGPFFRMLKSGPFCGGTEKWSILWGHLRVVHLFGILKSGPFCGVT